MSFSGITGCSTDYVEQRLIVIAIDKSVTGQVSHLNTRLITAGVLKGLRFVVYVDKQVESGNMADVAWLAANNCDPQRDCFMNKFNSDIQDQLLAIDGTRKTEQSDGFNREWPNIIAMSEAIIQTVDTKWERYGIGPFIPSPSLHYRSLTLPGGAAVESPEE
jgi:4-hydroxy-3-polyprenylbenzoate decarboxylase